MTREADALTAILAWLDGRSDLTHWRVSLAGLASIKGRGRRKNPMTGHPDIAGVLAGGRYFVIEVKRPKGGRFSPEQLAWRERLEAKGVLYIAATSVEDVAAHLAGDEVAGRGA